MGCCCGENLDASNPEKLEDPENLQILLQKLKQEENRTTFDNLNCFPSGRIDMGTEDANMLQSSDK